MSDQSTSDRPEPEPNLVLRGGKYEGTKLCSDLSYMLGMAENGTYPIYVYRPTGEPDVEFPGLAKYDFFREERGRG
jgi:hypothetical protein